MDILQKAADLLSKCDVFTLASVNESGYPRICVMGKTKAEGIHKIWCTTGLTGTKTKHFLANPKASVCYWQGGDSVTLTGKVTVETDRAIREEMWCEGFTEHFPGGIDDPNYCVLEFTSEEATIWIEGEFVTLEVPAL